VIIDEQGRVTLSGKLGPHLQFDGNPALQGIGAQIKRVSIRFHNEKDMNIGYTATVNVVRTRGVDLSVSVNGSFDLKEILSLHHGLGNTIRQLEGRSRVIDEASGY